jgi:hypothetical protein
MIRIGDNIALGNDEWPVPDLEDDRAMIIDDGLGPLIG